MGVDYGNVTGTPSDNGSYNMKTNLQLFKIAVPLAMRMGNHFSLGVEPVVQLGSLEMNYMKADGQNSNNPTSTSAGIGFEVGAAYNYKGLTIGGVYKSEIEMSYDNTISNALNDFGMTNISSGDTLTQPAEYGIGLAYTYHRDTISFDYRLVTWSSATGYGDFGWEDQNIFALGYEHQFSAIALRVGYNYAESPIVEQNGAAYNGAAMNFFNLAGFPGIVEHHLTLGLGYNMNKAWSFDGAFVYSPETSESFDISALNGAMGLNPESNTANVSHSQMALTLGLSYKFL